MTWSPNPIHLIFYLQYLLNHVLLSAPSATALVQALANHHKDYCSNLSLVSLPLDSSPHNHSQPHHQYELSKTQPIDSSAGNSSFSSELRLY